MPVLERWYLTNTLAGHNKFYEVVVDQKNPQSEYEVKARYGKIGTDGKWMTKHKGKVMNNARRCAEELVKEKEGRGYIKRSEIPTNTSVKLAPGKSAQASIALDRFANLE